MTGAEAYRRLVRPKLAELLDLVHLDVTFERASGCHLWPVGSDEPILDLVGGYGTLFFGHNHPALVTAAVEHLRAERPVHAQGALRTATGALAARLSELAAARLGRTATGDPYRVLFANSGAEAVEAAIKHAMLERPGPLVALEGGFHGKTLGALQLTANPVYRDAFQIGLDVVRVAPGDAAALREVFARRRPAALFLELIQGEGGVVPLPAEFAATARELCRDAALVVDECQTGLGRTGALFACEQFGVEPDLLILSKGLGGGLAKISAVLVRAERYRAELGLIHTSTFAEDELSAAVALRVLDLLTPETLAACAETGRWLKGELAALRLAYPDVVRDVRGMGLMLGVEFAPPRRSFLLRLAGDDLGLVLAGYLYHQHRIRVAPTLSNPLTLRIQPPVVTPRAELERLVEALRDVCARLHAGDTLGLTRYLLPGRASRSTDVRPGWVAGCLDCPTTAPRAGWLFHMNEPDDLVKLEPGFAALGREERRAYLRHIERRVKPVLVSSTDVTSRTGRVVRFNAIFLPITAERIRALIDSGETEWLRALVERGIDAAEELGCGVVSLGQYTSVAMRNGLAARPRRMGLTTGNAYAIALALEAVEREVPDLRARDVAVVGASGNIGGAASRLLARRCHDLTLIGSPRTASLARMRALGLGSARVSTQLEDCRRADVVVVAVSSPAPVLRAEHLGRGAVVCDLSVPPSVDAEGRADVRVLRGGIARLPGGEDYKMAGFPLGPGLAFACMAEGMLLALEGVCDRAFTGDLSADHVERVATMAARHGFALAEAQGSVARRLVDVSA